MMRIKTHRIWILRCLIFERNHIDFLNFAFHAIDILSSDIISRWTEQQWRENKSNENVTLERLRQIQFNRTWLISRKIASSSKMKIKIVSKRFDELSITRLDSTTIVFFKFVFFTKSFSRTQFVLKILDREITTSLNNIEMNQIKSIQTKKKQKISQSKEK